MVLWCLAMAMRAEPLNLKFGVTNFGPLASAEVDLRPLTIFIGPSNTGKSYMAILIYAFLRSWENLHYFRPQYLFESSRSRRIEFNSLSEEEVNQFKAESIKLREITRDENRHIAFSDFPELSRISLRDMVCDSNFLGIDLLLELMRCFDIRSIGDLNRSASDSGYMKISVSRDMNDDPFWDFSVSSMSKAKRVKSSGSISEFTVFKVGDMIGRNFLWMEPILALSGEKNPPSDEDLARSFERCLKSNLLNFAGVHYFPAARSGIMQSHRVIVSSLVENSAQAGLDKIQLPALSGVIADFLKKIVLYKERRNDSFGMISSGAGKMKIIADSMEENILSGEITRERVSQAGYPGFSYRPYRTKDNIGLARSSSMVAELAPVILFLRGYISRRDVLIIEEPEAHLHPGAQTKLAAVLAELIRNDVKVIITTHSEWLLQAISNLMREGQLRGEAIESEEPNSPALRPEEVGAWFFRPGEGESGSTVRELEFDEIAGISPPDYEEVDLALYNRSAKLQNQLQVRGPRLGSDYEGDTQDEGKT